MRTVHNPENEKGNITEYEDKSDDEPKGFDAVDLVASLQPQGNSKSNSDFEI